MEFCNSDLSNFCTNNDIKIIHGKPRHPQIAISLADIINIHNNKKHSITEEVPKYIRDLNNKDDIEIINERIAKNIGRKNKNKDIINFENYYCINSDLEVKNNRLIKNKKIKKKIKSLIFLF